MSKAFRQPAEWEFHSACWLAWPSHADLWQENLPVAQTEFRDLCAAIAAFGDHLKILVPNALAAEEAHRALADFRPEIIEIPFGDIWLRDTAPIFLRDANKHVIAASFLFNGWGQKYELPHDDEVSVKVARASMHPVVRHDWVLEGGSIESDGEGTILTSKQCLLNPNRNPSLSQAQIEKKLAEQLGAQKILWVDNGLVNDHTDGHIDTIARFVAPGEVVCMRSVAGDDPNHEILEEVHRDLSAMTDARGRKLKVHVIPSPGRVLNEDGEIMPASFLNFYIANKGVVVPTYGTVYDQAAVAALGKVFAGRAVRGLPARSILSGGGAFHCITQQEPGAPAGA